MMTDRYSEIDEVIAYIHKNIFEPLSLSRLAGHVSYSPNHFTRIFTEKIGLSPLYYVSSLRLQKSKDLLLRTNLTIRDIGLEIGQQSLGTFTTRFTERVGMTPSDFRNSTLQADNRLRSLQKLDNWHGLNSITNQHDRIEGTILAEVPFEGVILIGLFAKPIPEGLPLYGTLVSSLGYFCLPNVKPGTLLLNGYFGYLGDASHGYSSSKHNLAHTFKRTYHSRTFFLRSTSGSYALHSTTRRSTYLDFPAAPYEQFPQSSYSE